jgi:hypothetical protein
MAQGRQDSRALGVSCRGAVSQETQSQMGSVFQVNGLLLPGMEMVACEHLVVSLQHDEQGRTGSHLKLGGDRCNLHHMGCRSLFDAVCCVPRAL